MRKDYYAALGVAKAASAEEIKRAYRKLARQYHPDVNPGDAAAEERFKEISEAYHVLGNEDRRQRYDNVGPEAFAQEFDLSDFAEQFSHLFRGGRGGPGGGFGMFEDLLGGAGSRRRGPARGRDVQVRLDLSLEELLAGGERVVSYRKADASAAKARVKIPAGAREGSRIRLRGKGEPGRGGGPAGDLYLQVHLLPHPRFRLDGDDLRTTLEVTVYDAALGATVEIHGLEGSKRIKLPAGSRSGQVMRLRGQGGPTKAGGRGDLLATVAVCMPQQIDAEMAELFRRMRERHPYDPHRS